MARKSGHFKPMISGHSSSILTDARNHLIRDKAIAFLIMYAGPRVEELFLLNVSDIELREKSGSLHIRKGKGFKERRTSIPLPARKTLQAWFELYSDLDASYSKDSPLFIRLRGKPGGRLSIRAIQNMIADAGKRARIEEPVTPHILRHTCAFMLRQAGADIETRAKSLDTLSKRHRNMAHPEKARLREPHRCWIMSKLLSELLHNILP